MGYHTEGQIMAFGGKKAAPFVSAKGTKASVKRKAASVKTAKGKKKKGK